MPRLRNFLIYLGLTTFSLGFLGREIYQNRNENRVFMENFASYVLNYAPVPDSLDHSKGSSRHKVLSLTDLIAESTGNPYDLRLTARAENNRLVSLTTEVKVHLTDKYVKERNLTERLRSLDLDKTKELKETFVYDFILGRIVYVQTPKLIGSSLSANDRNIAYLKRAVSETGK